MNLYLCTVEVTLVVQAETPEKAEELAEYHAKHDSDGCTVVPWSHPINSIGDCPKEWLDALPFGGTNDKETIRKILTK